MIAIELNRVGKAYDGKPVISDFSLCVEKGERVVLHGPSGCGKSTILRIIAGFIPPDHGTVFIAGNLAARDGKTLVEPESRGLGMVFQDLALWPHMTVSENLEFVLKGSRLGKDRVQEMLTRVRLEALGKSYPTKLSGGQQQRVAIARALIAQPVALLMDEPLANLDDELKDELCQQLLSLHAELGFTLVYVTHGKDEMRRIGQREILLMGR